MTTLGLLSRARRSTPLLAIVAILLKPAQASSASFKIGGSQDCLFFLTAHYEALGGGSVIQGTPEDGTFFANNYGVDFASGVSMQGSYPWSIDFESPANQSLTTVKYFNDQAWRYPLPLGAAMQMIVFGESCPRLHGWFEILEHTRSGEGQMESLAANFVQSCNGDRRTLFGAVRFNSTIGPVADLGVAFVGPKASTVATGSYPYAIRVFNHGPDPVYGASLQHALHDPISLSWTCTASPGSSCTASGSGGLEDSLDLAPGGSAVYQVHSIYPSPDRSLDITVTINPPSDVPEWNSENNRVQALVGPGGLLVHDIDHNGSEDLFLQDWSTGESMYWWMDGTQQLLAGTFDPPIPDEGVGWDLVAITDFDQDGEPDLLWQKHTTRELVIWFEGGGVKQEELRLPALLPGIGWRVAGTSDFDGDGQRDLLLQSTTDGKAWIAYIHRMEIVTVDPVQEPAPGSYARWKIAGAGDFNADGLADILWQHTRKHSTQLVLWTMNGLYRSSQTTIRPPRSLGKAWAVAAIIDIDGNGHPDIVLQNSKKGAIRVWHMDGSSILDDLPFHPTAMSNDWEIVGPR